MDRKINNIRKDLKDYLITNNLKSLVIGVSGGVDSALVCALAKPICEQLDIPLIGRYIKIESNKEDENQRANEIGKYFCSDYKEIDLTDKYLIMKDIDEEVIENEDTNYKIRMGNIKARMRMIYLYNLASKYNGMVLSTDNKTEYLLGFFSLHGDVGDYEPIKDITKTEVYAMTEYIANNLTEEDENDALYDCINCDATDGLGISNTDLDQILPDWKERHSTTRSGYKEVDEILKSYFEILDKYQNEILNPTDKSNLYNLLLVLKNSKVIQRHINTEFKRK